MSIKRQIDWALDLVHIDYSTAPILNSAKLFGCFFILVVCTDIHATTVNKKIQPFQKCIIMPILFLSKMSFIFKVLYTLNLCK